MSSPRDSPQRLASGVLPLDTTRIEACLQSPEHGPRLLFLSGGSALEAVSRMLRQHTHNSLHLITPFDSGGSTAVLRSALGIFGVGDLRSRLLALADDARPETACVVEFMSHRLGRWARRSELQHELQRLTRGTHPLWNGIGATAARQIRESLEVLGTMLPKGFDLRGASVGNLLFSAEYLRNGRDLDRALRLFSHLLDVRGIVRPTSVEDVHLVAVHADGARTVGQHNFGTSDLSSSAPIIDLELVHGTQPGALERPKADAQALELIAGADLICYPMGSFFSSVLANLLPSGVGRAICAKSCPKVYVPNTGYDAEMNGYCLSEALQRLVQFVRRDAGEQIALAQVVEAVLIDPEHLNYTIELDLERVASLGVTILESPLAMDAADRVEPELLVRALISMAL